MTSVMSESTYKSTHSKSGLHRGAVLGFALLVLLSYQSPIFLVGGFILFLLVTSLHMVWKMLIFIALLSIVLFILPFLAPLAIILMIILFILRIGYVINNWRPIVLGLLLYGSSIPLFFSTQAYSYLYSNTMEPFIVSIIGAAFLHFGLKWVYGYGYSTKMALGIMGSVPLVILAFILPFLKLHLPTPEVFFEAAPNAVPAGEPVIIANEVRPVPVGQIVSTEPVISAVEPRLALTGHTAPAEPVLYQPAEVRSVIGAHTQTDLNDQPKPVQYPIVNQPVHEVPTGILPMLNGFVQINPNIFAGIDVVQDGVVQMKTHSNIFGGQDIYGTSGQKMAFTQPNLFGGETLVNTENQTLLNTQKNVLGGHDIFDTHNQKLGYTTSTVNGTIEMYDKNGKHIGTMRDNTLSMK
ncbi:hypothetical protein QTL97_04520 [Sporosarcina thermotolerans]|uniref:Uncharacterized protein n=1 Tax=Sporosarcina thermotolerans TaxID=633404 RepID=A0AAW9AAH3_9BACL|nr:hypothetical protein [Sporosarcina thermotolerans]MDW0116186.1 hypothetical protein [Sporosarcina thermotolerans]WHT48162.1 hypothetical protein QNH10_19400 [Sporosarcina thermotolerans]